MRDALRFLYFFIRFPALSFTAVLPLLGAASVSAYLGAADVLALVAVAVMFHVFAYVLNDVVDLPLDRYDVWRTDYPLVRQSVQPEWALCVALVQVPLAFLATAAMDASPAAHGALIAAMALMTVYDLWGKRCAVPLLTDAVQATAWCALMLYGALVAGTPGAVTALLATHLFIYVMMINGVHGSVRDLASDWRGGARTTAIFFGVRPREQGGVVLPRRFVAYAWSLQAALVGVTLARLVRPASTGCEGVGPVVWSLSVGLTLFAALVPAIAIRLSAEASKLGLAGTLHLVASLGVLVCLYGISMSGAAVAAVLVLYSVPILAMWAHNGTTWG
jgi:4-hydroxybenzoate polyprenyltransferase